MNRIDYTRVAFKRTSLKAFSTNISDLKRDWKKCLFSAPSCHFEPKNSLKAIFGFLCFDGNQCNLLPARILLEENNSLKRNSGSIPL